MLSKFHVHLPDDKKMAKHSFVMNFQQNQNTVLEIYNIKQSERTKNFGNYFCFH